MSIKGENPTGSRVWKMGRSFITKRQSGGHAARSSAEESRQHGESLCVVRLAFAAKRKRLDLCPLKPPWAVNTSRAAASLLVSGSGTKFNDTILKRWTAWESEWDKNSRVRIFFSQLGLFFLFQPSAVALCNYLLLCVLLKCWFVSLFNLALSRGLNVSEVVVVCCRA